MATSARARGSVRGPMILTLLLLAGATALGTDARADVRAATRARSALDRLEVDGITLQGALRAARADRDGGRAACIDEALTRIHVATRTARVLTDAINAEERSGDGIGVARDLTRIVHLSERTAEVFAHARRCGLPEGLAANDRTVVTAHAPDLPPGGSFPRPAPHLP